MSSFGGFFDNSSTTTTATTTTTTAGGGGGGGGGVRVVSDIPLNNMPTGVISRSRVVNHNHHHHHPYHKPAAVFKSPGLSLGLQTNNMDGHGGGGGGDRFGENLDGGSGLLGGGARLLDGRELDEYESRSGSDNMDGANSDDQDTDKPPRKKRYHRHTPQQIQELEALFKECPHPDEKQRNELSRRLVLEARQVKFWFQNRRTQMKTQIERHENSILRQENDKLRAENMNVREAMRNPMCNNCGGAAVLGDVSLEEQHLRVENARLKEELDRVCALAGKFLGRPVSSIGDPLPPSMQISAGLDLAVGINGGFGGMNHGMSGVNPNLLMGNNNNQFRGSGGSGGMPAMSMVPHQQQSISSGVDRSVENSMYLDLAMAAMEELVRMAQTNEPVWIPSSFEGGKETFNRDEYTRMFAPCIGSKPNGFVTEATRETGVVIVNSVALVETLMDAKRYVDMFPCVIARCNTTDVISSGVGGTRNGALQLMHAEFQVLSPLVQIREVNFLRFCKQHAEGVWAVVDISVDANQENSDTYTYLSRRLPSGCVIQDMPNGYCKVTWVEHAEYDENSIHRIYQPLVNAGLGFGAQKWVATLQRQCECIAILMSNMPIRDQTGITQSGRKSMLKLAQRMTQNFCAGVCPSSVHKWNRLSAGNVDADVRVMTRKSIDDPGEPPGVVLSAATSVWLPISPQKLFDFLRDERLRSEWDILSNGGPMQQMSHINKGQDPGNCVSLLRAGAMNASQSSMLILQETCIDASGSLVVYAPVDIPAMHVVMSGGDSAYVALLPSGFSIVPDGGPHRQSISNCADPPNGSNNNDGSDGGGSSSQQLTSDAAGPGASGSLLTVAFQILVNSLPTAKLTVESVETVNNLISCTVQKIKAALNCEN
ncbi:hypothetical protein C5167_004732 [Papaver somniferum]|uniref:Homeobox domain-containing protein n=2 Tax=Papaver somniferum TaxID=3469 RepID=A0A4Y7JBI9_PAPSO|nr:homeobox-leucine zipper protein ANTHOCYANINLESS 2-like isoform X1 [Papaver somniferum]XP_026380055.1 homeobox-leucine zipper protein ANTHOCYANINLESS 2-like isoform X1 [Papaver somniferum]RZC57432.1 hypothetical protein C5167_004732 [Papaver somniferum]